MTGSELDMPGAETAGRTLLFCMRHPGYVRNFGAVLSELAGRGVHVVVAYDRATARWLDADPVDGLRIHHPTVRSLALPARPRRRAVAGLRQLLDHAHFQQPAFASATPLVERSGKNLPRPLRAMLRNGAMRRPAVSAAHLLESLVRPDPGIGQLLDELRPDAVLVTPLIGIGSDQVDHVRAAVARGIPCGHAVASWDNLTTKGRVRVVPDIVLVWNHAQAREALELHGVPPDRVVVTGAQAYDHWFGWQPSTGADEFRSKVGLPAGKPYVLYACSSGFIAPRERAFFEQWLTALRSAGGSAADAGVLVRPHPQRGQEWEGFRPEDHPGVAVWPPLGADPVDDGARAGYFDSMHHAAAVVGLNTSALIEAAIVDRPVHSVSADAAGTVQRRSLHFRHLAGGSGHVVVADTLGQHITAIDAALRGEDDCHARNARFVADFVRPYGPDVTGASLFADAVERLMAGGPTRR